MTTRLAPDPQHAVGSASIWVLGQVAGPRRAATVVQSSADAAYLDLDGICLAVLGARSVQVPCGVRTLLPELPVLPQGSEVEVYDGIVSLGSTEVLVTNIVDTTVPVLAPEVVGHGAVQIAAAVDGHLDTVRRRCGDDALQRLQRAEAASVADLLGQGPGLTPLGDDVLAGWLAGAVASRHPGMAGVRSEIAFTAREATNVVSATLLMCAARGEGVPELRSLLSGVATGNQAVIEQAAALLGQIGEDSGRGVLVGALLALSGHPEAPGAQ